MAQDDIIFEIILAIIFSPKEVMSSAQLPEYSTSFWRVHHGGGGTRGITCIVRETDRHSPSQVTKANRSSDNSF